MKNVVISMIVGAAIFAGGFFAGKICAMKCCKGACPCVSEKQAQDKN